VINIIIKIPAKFYWNRRKKEPDNGRKAVVWKERESKS
jgi:hypothetical protein